jgi:transposase
MAPRYGRSHKKSRVRQAVPFNRGNHQTMIGAISLQRVETALYGAWSADGTIFLSFIENNLCPLLRPGQVVVMDNVAFHRVAGVEEAILKTGSRLVYLPPYSPELNPIENMWSKIKNYLRHASARTEKCFKKEIKTAFKSISPENLTGWFKHCGYKDQNFREVL